MASAEPYDDIVDFLVKPKNIESALDLVEVVPLALDRLHIKFWRTLKEIVEQELRKRGVADDWAVSLLGGGPAPIEPEDFLKEPWGNLDLTSSLVDEDMPLYWAFWVEQENYRRSKGMAPLTSGFGFHSEKERLKGQQAAKLPPWAQKLFDKPGVGWKSDNQSLNNGWVIFDESVNLRARSELISLARGDDVEHQIASALFDLFDKIHKEMEAENARIRESLASPKRPRH